jgi:hypothetical protein
MNQRSFREAMVGVVVDLLHGDGEALMKHNKSSRGAGREKVTGEGLGTHRIWHRVGAYRFKPPTPWPRTETFI